jgi:hypothetical protein
LTAASASWSCVRLRGIKLDFDLNGAKMSNTSSRTAIGELEVAEAGPPLGAVPGSSIGILGSSGARLTDVDCPGEPQDGPGHRRPPRRDLNADQLIDLAPLLAAHVGIRIGATDGSPWTTGP